MTAEVLSPARGWFSQAELAPLYWRSHYWRTCLSG
jgi:hypothetical protein